MFIQDTISYSNPKKDALTAALLCRTDNGRTIIDYIIRKYGDFVESPGRCGQHSNPCSYVYKLCNNNFYGKNSQREWLVIMEKLPDTITNESRTGVINPLCAKFRADKLKVTAIINVNTLCTIDSITNYYSQINHPPWRIAAPIFLATEYLVLETTYTVGEIAIPNSFDSNLSKVCTSGIHYFRSIEPAFYYRDSPPGFKGLWPTWSDNGVRQSNRYVFQIFDDVNYSSAMDELIKTN